MEINDFNIIPLIERKNKIFLKFNDIKYFNEEYGLDYNYILTEIAFNNNINKRDITIAINESDIILNPNIVYNFNNIAIIPISENNLIYQFCEDCIDAFLETENEEYFELLINESKFKEFVKKAGIGNYTKKHPMIKNVFSARKIHEKNYPRINMLTGNINYLHESNMSNFNISDFIGPNAKKNMAIRLQKTAQQIIDKNSKGIAEKIAALHRLGNQLKNKEETTTDIEKKGFIQRTFDKVKNVAKSLINKITPSFLK